MNHFVERPVLDRYRFMNRNLRGANAMDHYFDAIAAGKDLAQSGMQALQKDGFIVITGPVPGSKMDALASAYDLAVLQADPADVGEGGATTRVHDFVNRSKEFDDLYLHAPLLEACSQVIRQPFKLSNLLARTLNPQRPAQKLHVDFPGDENGWPMVGFIFMVDEFRPENGATYFLPGSQGLNCPPDIAGSLVQACGPAGSMIVYNGSTWHGHAANVTDRSRRSIQGAYIRRTKKSSINLPDRMRPETLERIGPLAEYLLALRGG
jgi:Phytanoyl-CoA dioxygenase (PhyH)